MVYKSKIGLELAIPLIIVLEGSMILFITGGAWIGVLIFIPVIAFVLHMFLNTDYTIDGEILKVRCGFSKQNVDIKLIRKITDSSNYASSPALSLDRLELFYKGYDSVVVSPKNKEQFIKELLKVNGDIELSLYKTILS